MPWQTEQVKSHKQKDYFGPASVETVVAIPVYYAGWQVLRIKEVDAGNTMAKTPRQKQKAILSKYLRYVVSVAMASKV